MNYRIWLVPSAIGCIACQLVSTDHTVTLFGLILTAISYHEYGVGWEASH